MASIINKTFFPVIIACAHLWDAYVRFTQIVPYLAVVWGISKAYHAFLPPIQANCDRPSHHPGKTLPLVRKRSLPVFHPDANPAILDLPPVPALAHWYPATLFALIVDALVSALSNVTKVVNLARQTWQMSTVNALVAPLSTRLNRVAQIPNALTSRAVAYQATRQYFRPISFLAVAVVALVGASLKLVALLGLSGLVFIATGGTGTTNHDENNVQDGLSTPEMNNAGLTRTLQVPGGA